MGISKLLLMFLFILVILGSFLSVYRDITSTSNIKVIEQPANVGYAIVGVYVNNNAITKGGEIK